MKTRQTHPFKGATRSRTITKLHRALIWENMLGTIYARNAQGSTVYFDFDYDEARTFAGVETCDDLRLCRARDGYDGQRKGQWVLYGVREETREAEAAKKRVKSRERHWRKTGVSDSMITRMKREGWL